MELVLEARPLQGGSAGSLRQRTGGQQRGVPATTPPTDMSDTDKVLNFANWQLYIDQKKVDGEKTYPTMEAFEAETGIDVIYTEPINDNESYFAQIRPRLAAGNDIGQDSIVLTDWMASKMIRIGYLQKLDKANIPNADNMIEKLKHPTFDATSGSTRSRGSRVSPASPMTRVKWTR